MVVVSKEGQKVVALQTCELQSPQPRHVSALSSAVLVVVVVVAFQQHNKGELDAPRLGLGRHSEAEQRRLDAFLRFLDNCVILLLMKNMKNKNIQYFPRKQYA